MPTATWSSSPAERATPATSSSGSKSSPAARPASTSVPTCCDTRQPGLARDRNRARIPMSRQRLLGLLLLGGVLWWVISQQPAEPPPPPASPAPPPCPGPDCPVPKPKPRPWGTDAAGPVG